MTRKDRALFFGLFSHPRVASSSPPSAIAATPISSSASESFLFIPLDLSSSVTHTIRHPFFHLLLLFYKRWPQNRAPTNQVSFLTRTIVFFLFFFFPFFFIVLTHDFLRQQSRRLNDIRIYVSVAIFFAMRRSSSMFHIACNCFRMLEERNSRYIMLGTTCEK